MIRNCVLLWCVLPALCACPAGCSGKGGAGDADVEDGPDGLDPPDGQDVPVDEIQDPADDDVPAPDADVPEDGTGPTVLTYDVVVVGAGTGGTAAAIQAARLGASVALVEETDWIGGQMTAAAVTPMDEGGFSDDSGIYIEFINRVLDHYAALGKTADTCGIGGGSRSVEPSVGQQILLEMIDAEPSIDLFTRTRVVSVLHEFDGGRETVTGIEAERVAGGAAEPLVFESAVLIDATEYGDVIGMSPARYRVGNVTSDAADPDRCVQDITYVAVIKRYRDGVPTDLVLATPPPGYDDNAGHFASIVTADGNDWRDTGWGVYPVNWLTHIAYRSMQNTNDPENYENREFESITKSGVNWANDFDYTVGALEDLSVRRQLNCEAKLVTLQFLYYVQHVLGESDWAVADDEGFDTPYNTEENLCGLIPDEFKAIERHFPVIPYVRESRRLVGLQTLTASDIRREGSPPRSSTLFESSIAVGDYPVDLHDCNGDENLEPDLESTGDVPTPNRSGAFQIPFEVFIPEEVDGLLPAEKNLSLSRLASGACRLHPVTMHTGQAAGVLAALAVRQAIQPRMVDAVQAQWELAQAGARLSLYKFSDVPMTDPAWPEVELVSGRGILVGYGDGTFGVDDALSRAQAAVVLARLFELPTDSPPAAPSFSDVPTDHWAYAFIEAIYAAGMTSGCSSDPPAFCPDSPVTRAQATVMIISGLGLDPETASLTPYYGDTASDHWAFKPVQLATDLGLVAPCDTSPLRFCPDDPLSRVDAAGFAARTLLYVHR